VCHRHGAGIKCVMTAFIPPEPALVCLLPATAPCMGSRKVPIATHTPNDGERDVGKAATPVLESRYDSVLGLNKSPLDRAVLAWCDGACRSGKWPKQTASAVVRKSLAYMPKGEAHARRPGLGGTESRL
jgi:hypothetical protein